MGDENKVVEAAVDIWNPGGDPEQIRAAAAAWREMAGNLNATSSSLRSQANGATSSWTGSASDGFKAHIAKLTGELDEGAQGMNDVAGELDHIAGEIQRINDEIHRLYIEIGVTIAAGALLSVVTFGFSGAAAAGAAAVAAARAGTLVAQMGFAIVRVIQMIRSIKGAALVFRFAIQFSVGLGAKVFANVATGKSALDLDGDDWIDVALGGVIGAGAAPLARAPGFSRVISSPALREVAVGSFAGATGNVAGNVIKGEEITPGGVVTAALIGGTSAGIGYKAGNYAVNRLNRSLFGSPGIGSTPAPGYGAPRPAGAPRLWTPADGPIVPGGRGPAVVGAPGVKGMSVSTTPSGLYVARTARVPTGHPAVRGMGLGDTPSGLVVANSRGSAVPAGDPSLTTLPTRARPSGLHVIDGYMRNQAGVHVPNKYAYSEALTPVAKEASAGGAAIGPQGTAGAIWEDNGAFWDQPQRLDQHDGLASSQLGDAADRLSHDWGPRTQPFPPQQPPPPPDPPPGGGASPTLVAGGGTHQVAAGDTLWSIAEREYGDGSYARLIARANPHITDPNLVRPGDRLVLPPIPQPATAAP